MFGTEKKKKTDQFAPHDEIDEQTPLGDALEEVVRRDALATMAAAKRDMADPRYPDEDAYDMQDMIRAGNDAKREHATKKVNRTIGSRAFKLTQKEFIGSISQSYESPDVAAEQADAKRDKTPVQR